MGSRCAAKTEIKVLGDTVKVHAGKLAMEGGSVPMAERVGKIPRAGACLTRVEEGGDGGLLPSLRGGTHGLELRGGKASITRV